MLFLAAMGVLGWDWIKNRCGGRSKNLGDGKGRHMKLDEGKFEWEDGDVDAPLVKGEKVGEIGGDSKKTMF